MTSPLGRQRASSCLRYRTPLPVREDTHEAFRSVLEQAAVDVCVSHRHKGACLPSSQIRTALSNVFRTETDPGSASARRRLLSPTFASSATLTELSSVTGSNDFATGSLDTIIHPSTSRRQASQNCALVEGGCAFLLWFVQDERHSAGVVAWSLVDIEFDKCP